MKDYSTAFCDVAEFDNVLQEQAASEQIHALKALQSDYKQVVFLCRKALLSEYYHVPETMVDALFQHPHQQRKSLCYELGVDPDIFRTLLDYTRYPDCYNIYRRLKSSLDFRHLAVLDYGCLVSDYGFFFGMLGSKISICDLKEHADFASFRLSRHRIPHTTHYAPIPYSSVTHKIGLAIFGEVLEHLDDPLELLESCVENRVQYLYTTHYPYGDDDYFNLPGHTKEAQKQAQDSLMLLRSHFHEISVEKNRRLWVRKSSTIQHLAK